jgi:putative transposase
MRRSKFRATQIVGIPKDAEAGEAVRDQLRKSGVSPASFFKRRSKYSGAVSDAKRLRELEAENTILKRVLADLTLEKAAIKERWDAKVITPCFPETIEAFLRAGRFPMDSTPPHLTTSSSRARLFGTL